MAQLIPTVPGIGAAFGTGLAKGINAFTEAKIKQMLEGPQNELIAKINSFISGAPAGQGGQAGQQVQPSIDQLSGQQQQAPQQQVAQGRPQITREQFAEMLKGVPAHLQGPLVANFIAQEKAQAAERRHQENKSLQERTLLNKIAGPELAKSAERAEIARQNIPRLENAIKIAEKGDIRSGAVHSALSLFGLERWGANLDTQLIQAIINDYNASQVKSFTGGGVLTNSKLRFLQDAGPALWKSPEGIIAVSKNKLLEQRANIALDDAENEVVEEYGSQLPITWKNIAAKRAAPRIQKLVDKAARNVEKALGLESGSSERDFPTQTSQGGAGYSLGEDASNLARNFLRTGSRVLETAGGAVGSGLSLVPDLLNAISGGATPSYEDIQNKIPLPPTISQVSKFAQEKSGGYLSPQSPAEEFSDAVIPDLVTFLAPIGGRVPFRNAIIKALGGNTASWLTKTLGGGPFAQGVAKLGFNVAASLPGGRKSLEEISKNSYQEAEKLAEGHTVPTAKVNKVASEIFDKYSKDKVGAEFVRERAKNIANLTKPTESGANISLKELWDSKKDLNGFLSDYKTPDAAKAPIKLMVGAINDTIEKNAPKNFVKVLNRADEIHAGLKSASDTSKFLQENLDKPTLNLPFVSWLVKNLAAPIGKGAAKLGRQLIFGQAAEKALDASSWWDLISRSPQAQQYYYDLVKASLAKDVLTAKKSAEKLNKVVMRRIEKEED